MTKLYEALCAVASEMVGLEKLSRKAHGQNQQGLGPMLPNKKLRKTETGKAYLRKKNELERKLQKYAADPELRPHMTCWMIDFEGSEAAIQKSAQLKNLSDDDIAKLSKADFGVIPKLVRDWCDHHGFTISDSGSGSGGWHLGVPCNDSEAERLCRLAHEELKEYIEPGILDVSIKFWGWEFTEIYTAHEAREFIKNKTAS